MTLANYRLGAFAAVATFLLTAAAAVPARAEVRDEAEFFSARVEQQADERMQRIRQQHGKDVVVETLPALTGAPAPGKAREDFLQTEATRRGQEAGVNGLYVMISRKPSSFYIGIDPDTQKQMFTSSDRVRVREIIKERFNANDFDGGLVAALDAIDKTFAANASGTGKAGAAAAPAAGGAAAAPAPARSEPRTATDGGKRTEKKGGGILSMFGGLGGLLCMVIAGLAVFALVRGMARRRQMAAQGYGQPGYGQPGPGQPGYGQPGYDPRYPQQQQGGMMGGGGGMGRGILGGLLGGMAGGYLYDQMRGPGGGNEAQAATPPPDPGSTPAEPDAGFGGGDFGGGDAGGGGGDFGGGDFGGGDFGGGE